MENNNQKIIIFKGDKDPNDVIIEILENNGLKESLEDYIDKIDKKQEPWLDILYKSAKDVAGGIMADTDFVINIQKQLNISEQAAKNILKEIKEKLIPMASVLTEEEIEKESLESTSADTNELANEKKTFSNDKKPMIERKAREKETKTIEPVPEKNIPKIMQKKGPDSYREPIE